MRIIAPRIVASVGVIYTVVAAPVAFLPLESAAGLAKWRVINSNGSIALPATVPGCAHTDLVFAGLINEPYVDENVDAQKWVPNEDWTWAASFDAVHGLLGRRRVELVAEVLQEPAPDP